MSEVNRVLVFKSNEAKKQNPRNKPGNFTTRFTPEYFLNRMNNIVLVWIIFP